MKPRHIGPDRQTAGGFPREHSGDEVCAPIGVQGVVRIIVDDVKRARRLLDRDTSPIPSKKYSMWSYLIYRVAWEIFAGKLA